METIKKILKAIGSVLFGIALGIAGLFFFQKKDEKSKKEKAEKAKEDKKNELEEMSADDIVNDSPNADVISENIAKEQEDFRNRIRDRLEQNLHGQGSSGDN